MERMGNQYWTFWNVNVEMGSGQATQGEDKPFRGTLSIGPFAGSKFGSLSWWHVAWGSVLCILHGVIHDGNLVRGGMGNALKPIKQVKYL